MTEKENLDEEVEGTSKNKKPSWNEDENEISTPPFDVDLLMQENPGNDEDSFGSTATVIVGFGGWGEARPTQWTRVFQVRSMDGGADFYVDRDALGEVAAALLRDLTAQKAGL